MIGQEGIDKKRTLICERCEKEFSKGYCWSCFQEQWCEWLDVAYQTPKYSEILRAIRDLEEKQDRLSFQLKFLITKGDKKKGIGWDKLFE